MQARDDVQARQVNALAAAPVNNNNNNNNDDDTVAATEIRGPSGVFVLTTPPRRVPLLYLSEPWSFPVFSTECEGWMMSMCFLHRCHLVGQYGALSSIPTADEVDDSERRGWHIPHNRHAPAPWVLPCLCVADLLTAGMPCGAGYSGLGSACLGCHVRTLVRKTFHIAGSGFDDLVFATCCATLSVRQQQREMLQHSLAYDGIPCAISSDEMR